MNAARKTRLGHDLSGYLFILPNYLIYFVFVVIPMIWVIALSFTEYSFQNAPVWVGLQNFKDLLDDPIFLDSLRNTFMYAILTIFPGMALGLLLAVMLNQKIRGVGFLRTAVFMPNVVSLVAVSVTWLWIYDLNNGLLNQTLSWFGVAPKNWLFELNLALPAVVVTSIWSTVGYNMIIYLAGLQSISSSYYEAARVDGASGWHAFWHITLPLLKPTTFFLFVISSIKAFQVFDQVYVMTNGGPANATSTVVHQIYLNGFQLFHFGYAAAMAVVLLVITALISLLNIKFGNQGHDLDVG